VTSPAVLIRPISRTSAPYEGRAFSVVRRTRWAFALRVHSLDAGGSVDVRIETASRIDPEAWSTLYTFPTVSAVGETIARSYDSGAVSALVTMTGVEQYIRAVVYGNTGEYVVAVEATARFLDAAVPADRALLSKKLREWDDSRDRLVEEAEDAVLSLVKHAADPDSNLHALVYSAEFYPSVRRMIARQADHIFEREMIRRKAKNPHEAAKAFGFPNIHPDVESWAGRFSTKPRHLLHR